MSAGGSGHGGASDQQTRYQNEMVQLKAHVFYLDYHLRAADRIEFWINCITAVASSTSIATWAVWQAHAFVWGAVIAVSQFINAVKYLLPYARRRDATNKAGRDLEALFVGAESDYYYVAGGELTDEEINRKTTALKRSILEVENECLASIILPRSKKFERLAAADAADYFSTTYPTEI